MKKKVLALSMALLIGISTIQNVFAQEQIERFKDMGSHWAKKTVESLVDIGVISGYSDNTFRPNNTITKSEFAKLVRTSLKLDKVEGNSFDDTKNHWGKDEIHTLVENGGIDKGEYGKSFNPDEKINRLEMAKIIVNSLGLTEQAKEKEGTKTSFADDKDIPNKDKGYILLAVEKGIITGNPDNTFKPFATATRAEACQMVSNVTKDNDKFKELENGFDGVAILEEKGEEYFNKNSYEISQEMRKKKYEKMEEYTYSGDKADFPEPIIKVEQGLTGNSLFRLHLENKNNYAEHFTFKTEVVSDTRFNRFEGMNPKGEWEVHRLDYNRTFDTIGKSSTLWHINHNRYALRSERDGELKLYDGMEFKFKTTITNTHTGESREYFTKTQLQALKYK